MNIIDKPDYGFVDDILAWFYLGDETRYTPEAWEEHRVNAKKQFTLKIDELLIEELEQWRLRFDSENNAHLWGDYGFSGREAYSGVNEVLDKMKGRIAELKARKDKK